MTMILSRPCGEPSARADCRKLIVRSFPLSRSTEAFSRVRIDSLLRDVGWPLTDSVSIHFEFALPGGTRADYVLCYRRGRPLAVLEAKRTSIDPVNGRKQAPQPKYLILSKTLSPSKTLGICGRASTSTPHQRRHRILTFGKARRHPPTSADTKAPFAGAFGVFSCAHSSAMSARRMVHGCAVRAR
jgi:hypothetical protein